MICNLKYIKLNRVLAVLLVMFCTQVVATASCADCYAVHPTDSLPQDDVYFEADTVPQPSYKPTIYDLPYSLSENMPNVKKLVINTATLYAAGVLTLGVLELLPEDATAWNKKEIRDTPLFERWWNHVREGPVWDKDNWVFKYILHPYGGAAYYMSARTQGCSAINSILYAFGVSTIFWEYGIEAFNEIPS